MKTKECGEADHQSQHNRHREKRVIAPQRIEHLNDLTKDIPKGDGNHQDSRECQCRAGNQTGHSSADGNQPQAGHKRSEE